MPTYYFEYVMRNADQRIQDEDGAPFPNDESAVIEARNDLCLLASDYLRSQTSILPRSVVVLNHERYEIAEIDFMATVLEAFSAVYRKSRTDPLVL